MTLGYSAAQVRAAEATLITAGVPLMRRAAAVLAAEIRLLAPDAGRVVLLVGPGDNGGDALFAGAELAGEGADVVIVPTGSRLHENGSTAALHAGARLLSPDTDAMASVLDGAGVIVDGILGTGSSTDAALRGRARDIVSALLPTLSAPDAPWVVAVDLPSGIHPDTGAVTDPTVLHADLTVTFGGVKAGLLRSPGSEYAGRVVLADIGLGAELAKVEPVLRVG